MTSPSLSSMMLEETDSKRVNHVSVYRINLSGSGSGNAVAKKRGVGFKRFHLFFLACYVYQIYWVSSTIGEPYRKFLEKADKEGFQVMEGTAKMRAELEYALSDIDNPDRLPDKVGWFDWMNMDIEEHAERKKRDKEQSVLDSLPKHMRVPKRNAPEFIPMLISGILLTLHALVMLMQHWSVAFNVWLNYTLMDAERASESIPDYMMEVDEDDEEVAKELSNNGNSLLQDTTSKKTLGEILYQRAHTVGLPPGLPTHARVSPAGEKDFLVPLLYLPTLGMTFEYHRRRYVYSPEHNLWQKIRCTTTMPTTFFQDWKGLSSHEQITASQLRFGPNIFDVKQPTFKELYKAQLLSPFTVFQLFCVILWLLDDYWQYSFFTLVMILVFEATVVFSRIKSLSVLKGMGNKSRPVLVYRMGQWISTETDRLLPGDVMSLTRHKPHFVKDDKNNAKQTVNGTKSKTPLTGRENEDGDVVPADVLLLRGSAVVNEASLTGESVPQMKEGMGEIVDGEQLSMKNQHKTHVLYAGTKMLQCKGVDAVEAEQEGTEEKKDQHDALNAEKEYHHKLFENIPKPPDGGSLCFVLRTGFSSSQGKLVRMIEGSQEKVKGHERETGLLLLLLFFFALASSSYVLYHGLQNDKQSQYELMLHCILIITSVIPPELPMQMALAVNNSLMTLMKMQVFCTEPYRVPMAGKLDVCLFDKTGTLTTDELVAVGVCDTKALASFQKGSPNELDNECKNNSKGSTSLKKSSDLTNDLLVPMTKINNEAALVLASCHSLVLIEGETTGDPLEKSAISAMRWGICSEKNGHAVPLSATDKKSEGKAITVNSSSISQLEVLGRHHFSSKLQRMSCVARDMTNRRYFAVAKGSPEAIGKLLKEKPDGYDKMASFLAKRGYRVIALGYKVLGSANGVSVDMALETRSLCEEDIIFAGFIAFTCRVRRDTKLVLSKLKEGGMSVAMVTGDALLTAAHVAKEVGICSSQGSTDDIHGIDNGLNKPINEKDEELIKLIANRRKIIQQKQVISLNKEFAKKKKNIITKKILILEQDSSSRTMFWKSYDDESRISNYLSSHVPELSKTYDLATTGKNLAIAFEYDEGTKRILAYFKIFARMTPDAKETVIECLHSVGMLCLMCGDGANDVGALKQADVGVALLTGFGDLNVDKGEDGNQKKKKVKPSVVSKNIPSTAIMTAEQLQALRLMPVSIIKAKLKQIGTDADNYPELIDKEDLVKLFQIKSRERAIMMHERKLSQVDIAAKKKKDMAERQEKILQRVKELEAQGVQWAQFKAMKEIVGEEMARQKKNKAKFGTIEGQAATMAAQFEDLELEDIPMVKLGDASIAAPFTSKMPSIRSCVDIIRQGRCTLVTSLQMYQILALNCLISAYSLSVLYLDGVKYGDVQMTAMGMLMSVSFMSVSRSKPLEKLSPVKPLTSIFHPSMFISLLGQFGIHLFTMYWAVKNAKKFLPEGYEVDLDGEFKPGIVNSVVFLVSNVQQVTVFVVNLQGRPFMTGLTENRPLLWSLIATFVLTFMFASESVPGLNKYFQLVPFPNEEFRDFILKILIADVALTLLLDRAMKLMFCPEILFASVSGTTMKDVVGVGRTIGIILALMYMFLGNEEQWEEMLREEGREDELLSIPEGGITAADFSHDSMINETVGIGEL
eukprot:CAMPEP_0184855366 /NCGR_PEP_ID=MMETSP0580-20130426/642_1 /TAXON_ID=1118495 /ORGANISM="Dactyliosolen fragilissimus" /LENGTH=1656 /DNA_ID=CAMNT_0027349867 /DNA_START=15 /DNA_END=4985 /DNA_ORIENTATION=-